MDGATGPSVERTLGLHPAVPDRRGHRRSTARFPSIFDAAVATAILLSAVLGPGCGDSGTARHAGMTVVTAESGDYRVRYLAPPWRLLENDGSRLALEIENNAASVLGIRDSGVPPKYRLVADLESGTPRSRGRAEVRMAADLDREVLVDEREITSDFGDAGFEVLTRDLGALRQYHRAAFFTHRSGAVALRFVGTPDLDEAEVTAMIRATEALP